MASVKTVYRWVRVVVADRVVCIRCRGYIWGRRVGPKVWAWVGGPVEGASAITGGPLCQKCIAYLRQPGDELFIA